MKEAPSKEYMICDPIGIKSQACFKTIVIKIRIAFDMQDNEGGKGGIDWQVETLLCDEMSHNLIRLGGYKVWAVVNSSTWTLKISAFHCT